MTDQYASSRRARAGAHEVERFTVAEVEAGALDDRPGTRPFVVEGGIAASEATRTWSLDWFARSFGDGPMHVSPWLKDTAAKKLVMASKVPLAEAIAMVRKDPDLALRSCADILYSHPELLGQLGIDPLMQRVGYGATRTDLWMAPGGNISPFHTAGGGNLFCMVHGEKRWTLVPPNQSRFMYPEVGRNAHALYVDSKLPATPAPALDSLAERFPLFAQAGYQVAHLKAGDVLYNPPWWWHQVENLTETVAAAHRFQPRRYRPDLMNAYFYGLSAMSRPKFLYDIARGQVMSDDATHLADHTLALQTGS